jgi:ribonuclease D
MIKTQQQLDTFLTIIKDECELAIDTEFKRVNTYFPILCLLQIKTKNSLDCIDILANLDLTKLFEKLYHPNTLWIVHSARQDIEVLYFLSGKLPCQLFDTQIAVGLLGGDMQISYQAITKNLQGILLEKAFTRLDWSKRPIPDLAIQYALDDVIYLMQNYQKLRTQLKSAHKYEWLLEEGKRLSDKRLYHIELQYAWQKVKGFSRLNSQQQILGAKISAFREQLAIQKNKPRKWLLSDEDLLLCAKQQKLFPKKMQLSFEDFLQKNSSTQDGYVQVDKKPPNAEEKNQKKSLQNIIQETANAYNLNPSLIANNKDILNYIRGDKTVVFLSGWRYKLLHKELNHA